MSTPKKQTGWIQYVLLGVFILVLFFTDLGTTIRGGVQQLLLKTGIKDAPAMSEQKTPATQTQSAVGYPQLRMTSLANESVELSDLKGKVVFLNQWATWCPPCRAEMPAIEKLYESVDKTKVAFVMLSLDEDPQKARQFVKQNNFTFPVYVPGGPMPEAFQCAGHSDHADSGPERADCPAN